jgi:hypothetical protein
MAIAVPAVPMVPVGPVVLRMNVHLFKLAVSG